MQFAFALVCRSKKAIERRLFFPRKPKGRCKKLLSGFLQLPVFRWGDPTRVHGWREAGDDQIPDLVAAIDEE
jgi:hypothetical protein